MKRLRSRLVPYRYIIISFIGIIVLYLLPLLASIFFSFTLSGYSTEFVGFMNYNNVIHSGAFQLAFRNTIEFLCLGIPISILWSLLLAILLNKIGTPLQWTLFIISPMFIPSASVTGFFRSVFDTFLLSDNAMIVIILIFIWRTTGYSLLVYLVALNKMDSELLEAAYLDGASELTTYRKVVLPLLTPATIFAVIISLMNGFKVYKDIYVLQGAYPNSNIYMLQHYMNNTFRKLDFVKLVSSSNIFSILIIVLLLIIFILERSTSKKINGV